MSLAVLAARLHATAAGRQTCTEAALPHCRAVYIAGDEWDPLMVWLGAPMVPWAVADSQPERPRNVPGGHECRMPNAECQGRGCRRSRRPEGRKVAAAGGAQGML